MKTMMQMNTGFAVMFVFDNMKKWGYSIPYSKIHVDTRKCINTETNILRHAII